MYRTLLAALGCCGMLAAQQASNAGWSVQQVRPGTLRQIETDMSTLAPDAGSTLVEAQALLRSAGSNRSPIRVSEVFLQTAGGAKSELAAVGVVNKTGACTYQLTRGLVKGFVSVSTGESGFKLGRQAESEPLGIAMTNNPEWLCFAFLVAERASARTILHVAGATAPVVQDSAVRH